MKYSQVTLIILDGWGYRKEKIHNAIALANKPFYDSLIKDYPNTLLEASGEAVGLESGKMGNSEVGHNVIGAGRIVESDIVRINKSIQNGTYGKKPSFEKLFEHVLKNNSTLHISGLVSSGGVHSHEEHLYAFLKIAKEKGLKKIVIHAFTDGMDNRPGEAVDHIKKLDLFLKELGVGRIASVSGRYYAMDRDNNWDRVKKVEDAIFECKGNVCQVIDSNSLLEAMYKTQKDDTHIGPIVCLDYDGNGCSITDNDGVFFFNFRPDRARMLSHKIAERAKEKNIYLVTMTEYDDNLEADVVFPPLVIEKCLGQVISENGFTQARIAETEKYAHATYFLNTGHETPYANQENILIPSSKNTPNVDDDPEMQAERIAHVAIEQVKKGTNFIFVNFANPDVIGHTGNESATIKAVEAVDRALEILVPEIINSLGIALITADHGNAEIKYDEKSHDVSVTHTTNPVPLIITDKSFKLREGGLSDIAPTILKMFEIEIPSEMTGKILFD